jgi:riboflavin biosynthesis pyrimidine reductase
VRLLLNDVDPGVAAGVAAGDLVDDTALADLYAYPTPRAESPVWTRVNMVSTLDGAAAGPDGRTGSINSAADRRVFALLRTLADVVLVGAGTARAERYAAPDPAAGDLAALRRGRSPAPHLVVVSASADLPERLLRSPGAGFGQVWLATGGAAPADRLRAARSALGDDHVLLSGSALVQPRELLHRLGGLGLGRVLCEGGPTLLRDLLAAELVDEACLTLAPTFVGGVHPRILTGPPVAARMRPLLVLEEDGTLLTRWTAVHTDQPRGRRSPISLAEG